MPSGGCAGHGTAPTSRAGAARRTRQPRTRAAPASRGSRAGSSSRTRPAGASRARRPPNMPARAPGRGRSSGPCPRSRPDDTSAPARARGTPRAIPARQVREAATSVRRVCRSARPTPRAVRRTPRRQPVSGDGAQACDRPPCLSSADLAVPSSPFRNGHRAADLTPRAPPSTFRPGRSRLASMGPAPERHRSMIPRRSKRRTSEMGYLYRTPGASLRAARAGRRAPARRR